jgi:mitochondrial fission protein ELM1
MEKLNKTPTILILSDGKIGHDKQALAIGHLINSAKKITIFIDYRSPLHRLLFSLLIALPMPQLILKLLLQFSLKKNSFQKILASQASLIISAGSKLNAPNIAASKLKDAKNIVVMKPAWGRNNQYDLQIIPQHDTPPTHLKNIISTYGTPNVIGQADLKAKAKKLVEKFNLPKAQYLSVFIGGNGEQHLLKTDLIKKFLQQLNTISHELNLNLIITTSRRTPDDVNQIVKKYMPKNSNCALLIIPNEGHSQPDDLIEGMLGLSKIAVVTQDSVSMISEAASSHNHVVVIKLDKKNNKSNKHDKMAQVLMQQGYITLCDVTELTKKIENIMERATPSKILNDMKNVKLALKQTGYDGAK